MDDRLQSYVSHSLTPLQKAALERIGEFRRELAENGLFMRSGIELEFMVADENGEIVRQTIEMPDITMHIDPETDLTVYEHEHPPVALSYLRDTLGLSHIEQFKTDGSSEYEVLASDMPDTTVQANPRSFSPENVAATIGYLKESGLSHLLSSTCLSSAQGHEGNHYEPVFTAVPHEMAPSHALKTKSSALHVNVSLYDAFGNNLFAAQPNLMEHCCRSLLELQREGSLAVLPCENSLKRIGWNESTPHGIGLIDDYFIAATPEGRHSTVHKHRTGGDCTKGTARIENRLPGADADPYVAMAVTMAALVDAVRTHTRRNNLGDLEIDPAPEDKAPMHSLPKKHEELISQFEQAAHTRELLGEKLCSEIMREYSAASQHAV